MKQVMVVLPRGPMATPGEFGQFGVGQDIEDSRMTDICFFVFFLRTRFGGWGDVELRGEGGGRGDKERGGG